MTNKECSKAVEEQQSKAVTINNSINWAADRANQALDELEEIKDCDSFDCMRKREALSLEAEKYLNKLTYESEVLDDYGDELKRVMDLCECASGNINF